MIKKSNRGFALGRMKSGSMNKTETEYSKELSRQVISGDILWWTFEGITFKLADNTRYTPDFIVMTKDMELQAREIKGSFRYVQDDAKVKIKVAASIFPIRFLMIAPIPKKHGGGWDIKEIGG